VHVASMTEPHTARLLTAVVLAAGEGRRYIARSGRYKLLEPLEDGRPLIRAVCDTALAIANDVVVVHHWHSARLAAALSGLPVRLVGCENAARGMGASLKCGVQETRAESDILVMLADMPFVHIDTVKAIRDALCSGAATARPFHEGRPGHPVGFSASLRESLLSLDDTQGAAPLLRSRQAGLRSIDVADPGCIRDVDVPGDLGCPP